MKLLTKDAILLIDDRPISDFYVPEWDGTIRLRAMSAKDKDDMESFFLKARETKDFASYRARVVAHCVVDESGAVMFSEKDIEALGAKNGNAIERIVTEIQRLSQVTKEDIERLEKNS